MTHEPETDEPAIEDGPPPPLHVRYSATVQTFRGFAIFAVGALALIIPFVSVEQGPETWQFTGVIVGAAVIWALWTFNRARNRTPQVVVDENGVYFREWVVGTVPWENIDYIAHSSSIRRGLVASITRTRRKPYLQFRFIETPKVKPTAPIPFSWWQFVSAEFTIQEPVIQQYGLDTPVNTILEAIQAHIAHWQKGRPDIAELPEPPAKQGS